MQGAAIATLIANSLSVLCHIIYATKTKQDFLPNMSHFKACLKVNFYGRIMRRVIPDRKSVV